MVSLIVAGMVLLAASGAPQAASGGTIPGGIIAGVSFGVPPLPGGGGSSCSWRLANPHDAHLGRGGEVSRVLDGLRYWLYERRCDERDDLVWVPEMTPERLAEQASQQVRRWVPEPPVSTAPPADRAVVHVPMWFWTGREFWQPVEATAWVPHGDGVLWATARAEPSLMWFDPGDGALGHGPVSCRGPGPEWTAADGDHGVSPCSVTYRHASTSTAAGAYNALVRVIWTTSWHASDGSGGELDPLTSTAAVPIRVHEIHALVSR